MITFINLSLLILVFLLNIQCNGKEVEVKIKDDWKEKREFIYLKNVELKERFVLKRIERFHKRYGRSCYNIDGFLRPIELIPKANIFSVKINDGLEYIIELKMRVLIEIGNNKSIQKFLPGLEKRVFYILIIRIFDPETC